MVTVFLTSIASPVKHQYCSYSAKRNRKSVTIISRLKLNITFGKQYWTRHGSIMCKISISLTSLILSTLCYLLCQSSNKISSKIQFLFSTPIQLFFPLVSFSFSFIPDLNALGACLICSIGQLDASTLQVLFLLKNCRPEPTLLNKP